MNKKMSPIIKFFPIIIAMGLLFVSLSTSTVMISHASSLEVPATYYDTNWQYRKQITIDHTLVDANLTNFPVLISLDSDDGLASSAQSTGNDILFTDDSDVKLDHEIEYFDEISGKLIAWVEVTSISSTSDTRIYMYYGNPSASDQQNPQGVWGSNYVMVHHLHEITGTHIDSTINPNDGIPQNGLNQAAVGFIDGADDFDGTNQFIDIGTDTSLDVFGPNQDFSIFLWVKRDATTEVEGFFSSGSSGDYGIYFGSAYQNTDDLKFMSPSQTAELDTSSAAIADTNWHYVGVTADRDDYLTFWVDGASAGSASIASLSSENWNRVNDTYKIGTDRSETSAFTGILDEVRVSDIVRSPEWISAEYNNINNPGGFYSLGPEQPAHAPSVFNETPPDGSLGVSVSLSELSFELEDPDGDPMNYDVTTDPDIGGDSVIGVSNGVHTVDVSGLDYDLTYTWEIIVTDGINETIREFTFETETDLPIISNPDPADGATYISFDPTLSVDILDNQSDSVDWEISVFLNGGWQLFNSGTLATGNGSVSTSTSGVDSYGTSYDWRVRVRETGDIPWVEEIFSFTTTKKEMSFAAFTDSHIGARIAYSWGMADHIDDLATDIMNNTLPCDFVVHLGDIIMHSTAFVQGEGLPAGPDPYLNNLQAFMLDHTNMPFMAVSGNHDMNDYYGTDHASYPQNSGDPFNLVREIIDATEMNSYPYAFMKDNILFIALPETDYHMFTKPITYEYVEYMTQRYPYNTTIILTHQAIEDTTIHDGANNTYRGQQDIDWWADLFQRNPQIKMWIHGHQHMLDWYQSDHSTGVSGRPVVSFGHEMVFSHPYSQADWGDYHEEDRIIIYTISEDSISTKAWENNGVGGDWVVPNLPDEPGYDNTWNIATTYDETAQDWYSFPVFIQDDEIQLTDMKALSADMSLELIGTQPMELFFDSTMATQGTSWGGENLLGFGDDYYDEATPTVPGMTVHGPADLNFPPKYPGSENGQGGSGAYWEDGRTGQPYHFFPVGTSHAAVPGAEYDVTITARSTSGTGQIDVDLSVSDWGTGTQYSELSGSSQQVISHVFGTSYETVSGIYTVPNDEDAWFLQGYLDFPSSTDYDVSLFSIKRVQDTSTTDNFSLTLNETSYSNTGTLDQFEWVEFPLDPVTMADNNGVITITASIDGNHYGMANIVYNAPMLFGRNARFTVNSVVDNTFNITLQDDLSYNTDVFKMFPLSPKYGGILVSSDDGSAIKETSLNGNEWIESNTPTEIDKVTLTIEYGEGAPVISNEVPANFSDGVELNPVLQADVIDLQGDQVDWEIKSNASGTWQSIDSGTLTEGEGTVTATPSNMNGYDTSYNWSVTVTDPNGSGEIVEEIYQFTTRLENYSPSISNPDPADGSIDVQLNPILSIDVDDPDELPLDIVFETDASGTWQVIDSYSGVGNGTYTATPTDMDQYATTYNWRVEVNDGFGPVNQEYSFQTRAAPGAWWNLDWLYRKAITIDPNQVDEDLISFPVLIDLTDTDLTDYALASGDDIAFTDNSSVQLSHEIEMYDSGTGHLIAWVSVPNLSSIDETVIYLYFGNASAINQEDIEGTWDNDFVLIQHLDETGGQHYDSTGFDNDSSLVIITDQNATGTIDGADDFNGTTDYVRVPDAASLQFGEGSFTAEAWIYVNTVPETGGARIINTRGTGTGGSYAGYHLKIKAGTGGWVFGDSGIDDAAGNYKSYDGTTVYSYNQWHHVVMVYDADNDLTFYVDGGEDGTLTVGPYGSISNSLPTAIGAAIAHMGLEGTHAQFFDGFIDETRLSSIPRSAGWISTSYNNQNNPGTFYVVGNLELSTGPPEISNPIPEDSASSVSISLTQLSFDLHDPDGDPMDYVISTTPDIGSATVTDVTDGTFFLALSGIEYDTTYTWTVDATDGTDHTVQAFTFTTEQAPAPWWDSDWLYRKMVTIDHNQVVENLTYFPTLILIDDGSMASVVQDDGGDIVITDSTGTQLDHEIESYDPATGALAVWVNVPILSSTDDTVLYLYYGNSEASNQENGTAVWDSEYVLVQHLDEISGTHYDSTINANDGTPYNLASQDSVGIIDGADEFHDDGDLIDVGIDPTLDVFGPTQDFSIFMWVKRDNSNDVHGFFSSGATFTDGIFFGTANLNEDDLKFLSPSNTVDISSGVGAVGDTNWHYIGLTADRDGFLNFWVDGSSVHAADISGSAGSDWNRANDTYKIGTDRSESSSMDGILDEVRVSKIVRSAGWIETSYNNQNNPGAFYNIQQEPAEYYQQPSISLVSPNNGETLEAPVTFSYIPQSYAPGGITRAELWLNVPETVDGSVVYTDNTYAPQRAVIKDGKLIQVEGTGSGCRITVRDFPGGSIEKQGPIFGGATHSNTSVVIDGDVIYGICTDGVMQAWDRTTDETTYVWQISVGPGGSYSTTSNSMEVYNNYLYVQSADFVIHRIRMSDGYEAPGSSLALDNTGGFALKAHMLVDYDNNRLYALGDSNYYTIELNAFTIIRTTPIVTNGGRDTRGGPILVDDASSGQYLTIFTTFPQNYTYAVDFDGNIVWTWDEKPIRAHATYNPNTGFVYLTDATGYTDAGTGLTLPGTVFALDVSNGDQVWERHGDGTDRFSRPITASGNYLIFKTDNPTSDDYLYVLDATTGYVLSKIPAGGNKGYWCFPPALSGGYVATGGGYTAQGGNVLDIYHIGDGVSVDYYPLHGNLHHTGYVEDGLTSLGFDTTTWKEVAENESPIIDGVENSIVYDFNGQPLPYTYDWNIKVIQSDNQSAWGTERGVDVEGTWYNEDWVYRKAIIIDHTKVDTDLEDFPVLLDFIDNDLDGKVQANGDDILFTDLYGQKLDHEIELYQVNSPAHLVAWVEVPFVSSTSDTTLYMYYGNGDAGNQENVNGVWDDNYVMVLHLDETDGTHFDSTTYTNDGTTVVVSDQNAAGKIDGADELDGSDDHIRVPNDASLGFGEGSFTAEAWIFPQSIPDSGGARIINNRGTGAGGLIPGYQLKIANSNGVWIFKDTSIDDASGHYMDYEGTSSYSYGNWYHVVMVYDADNEFIVYVNGVRDGGLSVGAYGDISNSLPTAIGGSIADQGVLDADNKQFFDGIIDEVRLSNVARTTGWISAEYRNQLGLTSFYSIGTEETDQPTVATISKYTAVSQNGLILVNWETSNEIDLLGFNIYRSDGSTLDQVTLNTNMIQALSPGSLGGNAYSYLDALVEPGKEYSYWLEVVSTSGSTIVGPVTATASYVIYTPMLIR